MALEPSDVKKAARRLVQQMFVEAQQTANLTTDQIEAAITAADTWLDNNAAAYNSALPTAFRTTATAGQKAFLLAFLCLRRAGLD